MPQRTRHTVELTAGTIHYRESGPATGPPVLFVHGFLVDDGLWSDVPERLGALGFHALAPTWPLGSHPTPMHPGADLSPRGIARIVLDLVDHLGLHDVTLVGNDTGGAISQLVVDEDPSRIARLVLTDCDAFETFPPSPFVPLFRAARHPAVLRAALAPMRSARLRHALGFGPLVRRRLDPDETLPWVTPYLDDPGVRRDVAAFAHGWRRDELARVATRLPAYERPVLVCWAPDDRFFPISLARRLVTTFPDARLVEIPDARAFVALDQPERLADEIAEFVGLPEPRA